MNWKDIFSSRRMEERYSSAFPDTTFQFGLTLCEKETELSELVFKLAYVAAIRGNKDEFYDELIRKQTEGKYYPLDIPSYLTDPKTIINFYYQDKGYKTTTLSWAEWYELEPAERDKYEPVVEVEVFRGEHRVHHDLFTPGGNDEDVEKLKIFVEVFWDLESRYSKKYHLNADQKCFTLTVPKTTDGTIPEVNIGYNDKSVNLRLRLDLSAAAMAQGNYKNPDDLITALSAMDDALSYAKEMVQGASRFVINGGNAEIQTPEAETLEWTPLDFLTEAIKNGDIPKTTADVISADADRMLAAGQSPAVVFRALKLSGKYPAAITKVEEMMADAQAEKETGKQPEPEEKTGKKKPSGSGSGGGSKKPRGKGSGGSGNGSGQKPSGSSSKGGKNNPGEFKLRKLNQKDKDAIAQEQSPPEGALKQSLTDWGKTFQLRDWWIFLTKEKGFEGLNHPARLTVFHLAVMVHALLGFTPQDLQEECDNQTRLLQQNAAKGEA